MTAIHLHSWAPPRGLRRRDALDGLSDATHWLLGTLRQWRRRMRERQELARFDDRLLLDIGLNRADAELLINKPFWRE